jgi:hypothetical protein
MTVQSEKDSRTWLFGQPRVIRSVVAREQSFDEISRRDVPIYRDVPAGVRLDDTVLAKVVLGTIHIHHGTCDIGGHVRGHVFLQRRVDIAGSFVPILDDVLFGENADVFYLGWDTQATVRDG